MEREANPTNVDVKRPSKRSWRVRGEDFRAVVAAVREWQVLQMAAQSIVAEQLLADERKEVEAKSNKGQTALRWATAKGQLPEIQQLLKYESIEPDFQDEENRTPLSFGTEEGHEIVGKHVKMYLHLT